MVVKTREKLIEVARQLFAHKGVAKTTMNDIANASEKGRRTIYIYFKNKREIYNAVLETESEQMVTSLRKIVEANLPVEERLRQFLLFRLEHNNVQAGSSIKSWLTFDLKRVDRVNRLAQEKENRMLAELLKQGCASGVFRPDRCKLLLGFVNHTITRLDIPKVDPATAKIKAKIFNDFVEFVISDITAK